ncbi:uncharacterized protein BDZ99DRAFT_555576 [Mytilinidion resinicola]|uniref:Tachykinin family protein n=1 Tax=Mytilinidion resinicola TaxID=574789 RepID=A0A6A6YWL0_9PEZI|nr:uncharacterized protein BDZ99DRAFT_555576 [Mytilinidion resinicola]KAF2812783.1 hypothetical protein BDZ99DRAFT_555576 [Mytilinidion resinicola]
MPFQFIDSNASADRATRRRIRSHAAMGKNVGRKIVRPSRIKAFERRPETSKAVIHIPKIPEDTQDSEYIKDIVPGTPKLIGDWLSVLSFPEQRHRSKHLLSIDISPDFHCVIAVSTTALNNLVIKQEDSTETMRHLSRMFRIVNERLSGSDTVSDTTIAVVLLLTQYERIQNQYYQGLVHLEGLHRMAELRGGICKLTRDAPTLAKKIISAELEYALFLGTTTRFSIEDIMPTSTALVGLASSLEGHDTRRHASVLDFWFFKHLSAELQKLLAAMTDLAGLLNDASAGRRPTLNAQKFHDTVILLGYRLVQISPLGGPRPSNRLDNAVHLGLALFLMTLLRRLDRRIVEIPLLSQLARSAAEENFDDGRESQELLLWVLSIGGASVFTYTDDAWLAPKLLETTHALSLHTWEDVRRTVVKFPWINALHDNPSQSLYERVS